MKAIPVDERDSTWDDTDPVFRVYFFTVPDHAVETTDIHGTDYDGAQRWAQENAQGREIAICVVSKAGWEGQGVIWIKGRDLNAAP